MRLSGFLLFLVAVEVVHARAVRSSRSRKQGRSRGRESGGNRRPEQSPSCFLMTHARPGDETCQPSLVEIMNVLKPCTDQTELSGHLEKVIGICRFDKVKWQLSWHRVRLSGNGIYTLDPVGPVEGPKVPATTAASPVVPQKSKSVVKTVQNGEGKLEEVEYVYEYVYDDPEDPENPDPVEKDDHFRYEEPSMMGTEEGAGSVENLPLPNLDVNEAGQGLLAAEGEELHHLDRLKEEETEGLQRLQQIRQKQVEELEHIEVLKQVEKTEMKLLQKITDDILEKKETRQEIDNPEGHNLPVVLDSPPSEEKEENDSEKVQTFGTNPTSPSWATESVQPQQDNLISTEHYDERNAESSPNPGLENHENVKRPDEVVQAPEVDPGIPEGVDLQQEKTPKRTPTEEEEDIKDKERKEDEFLYGENVVDAAQAKGFDDIGSPADDVKHEDEVIAMANNENVEDDQDEDYDSSEEAEKGNYFVAATNEMAQPDEGQPSLRLESHHENEVKSNFGIDVESEDNPESPLQGEKVLQSEAMIGPV